MAQLPTIPLIKLAIELPLTPDHVSSEALVQEEAKISITGAASASPRSLHPSPDMCNPSGCHLLSFSQKSWKLDVWYSGFWWCKFFQSIINVRGHLTCSHFDTYSLEYQSTVCEGGCCSHLLRNLMLWCANQRSTVLLTLHNLLAHFHIQFPINCLCQQVS